MTGRDINTIASCIVVYLVIGYIGAKLVEIVLFGEML